MLGLMLDVFIEGVGGSQIAEVPVERGLIFLRGFGDFGHDYIAAIAGVAGGEKAPSARRGLLGARGIGSCAECEYEHESDAGTSSGLHLRALPPQVMLTER